MVLTTYLTIEIQLDRMIAGGVGEERRTPSISRVIEIVVMSVSHLTCLRV